MNRLRLAIFLALIGVLLLVVGGSILNAKDNDEIFTLKANNNSYVLAKKLVQAGPIKGDVYGIGEHLHISSPMEGDIAFIGYDIIIDAPVDGDVRVLAPNVVINSSISGDLLFMGGDISLSESATVGGIVRMNADKAVINGEVNGELRFTGSDLQVYGKIDGTLKSGDADKVTLNPSAIVTGEFIYGGKDTRTDVTIHDGATVLGKIVSNYTSSEQTDFLLEQLEHLVRLLIVALFGFIILRFFWTSLVMNIHHKCGSRVLYGIATALVLLTASCIPLALTQLSPVFGVISLIIFLLFVFVLLMGVFFTPTIIGFLVYRWIFKKDIFNWYIPMIGVVVLFFLAFVPFLVSLVWLFVALLTYGTVGLTILRVLKVNI